MFAFSFLLELGVWSVRLSPSVSCLVVFDYQFILNYLLIVINERLCCCWSGFLLPLCRPVFQTNTPLKERDDGKLSVCVWCVDRLASV